MWYSLFSCFDTCWQCIKKRHQQGIKNDIAYDKTDLIATSISLDTGIVTKTFMHEEGALDQQVF